MTSEIEVKERPILFSGPMVRAILEGRKTQTRRVVMSGAKNMQASGQVCVKRNPDNDPWYKEYVWSVRGHGGIWNDYSNDKMMARCPYGAPGDRLWVRETWTPCSGGDKASSRGITFKDGAQKFPDGAYYAPQPNYAPGAFDHIKWKPSIFMRRWASRITLEVTSVRVERVNEISHEDAVAEGCYRIEPCEAYPNGNAWGRAGFAALWDKINKARGFGWDAKPWVWVVEFRRIGDSL